MRLNTSWKDGYLVFDNTPIEEVIKKSSVGMEWSLLSTTQK